MTGGEIRTGKANNDGTVSGTESHAIYGQAATASGGAAPTGDIAIDLTSTTIETKGSSAHGVYASHSGTANDLSIDISMSGGSIVTTRSNANPIHFADTSAARTLALRGATLTAPSGGTAVTFAGNGSDRMTILGHGTANQTATSTLRGAVAFGGGTDDRLTFSTCRTSDIGETGNACVGQEASAGDVALAHTGAFTGLEKIAKIGSGALGLAGLSATGAAMTLEDGDLRLTGHLDLGSGSLTIHDTTKLIFGATSETAFGRITANQVKFDDNDWQQLYLATGSHDLLDGKDVLVNDSGSFVDSAGSEITAAIKLYNEAGSEIGSVASGDSTVNDGTVTVGLAPPPAPDNNECGAAPSGGGTITCNQNTYIYQTAEPTPPADAGIEYNALSGANDYTINISGTIDVDTTAAADRGLHAEHSEGSTGTGNLTINLSGGSIDTDGEDAGDRLHADGILARMRNAGNLAVTMSGGSIDAEGKYADGILAQVYTDYTDNTGTGSVTVNLTSAIAGGTCTAANRSGCDIHTEGEEGAGIYASAGASGASTTTGTVTIGMAGGNILTEGKWSDGLSGSNHGSNDVTITLSGGSIETGAGTAANTGRGADGIYGYFGAADPGDLTITMSNGRIATGTGSGTNAGAGARGIRAHHAGTGSATVTLSGGSITTNGGRHTSDSGVLVYDADGILLTNEGQGGNTSTVTMSGGSIDTEGARASGIHGETGLGGSIGIELTSDIAAGTCDGTTNTGCDIHTRGDHAHGIYGYAGFVRVPGTATGGIDIDLEGGDILTEGASAHGILGQHEGSGTIDIAMTGGSITTTGSGARGLYVQHTSSGTLDPVVVEGGTISAAQAEAIYLEATPAKSLALRNATITRGNTGNAIGFSGSTDDTLTIRGHRTAGMTATTTIRGNVAFGGGTNDSLEFNGDPGNLTLDHTGSFTGLENISKTGAGELRLADLSASGAAMALEDGDLRLTGHLDLGSGSLTIHDTTKLIFGATSETEFGKITANQVKFNAAGWQRLYLANGSHDLLDDKDVLVNDSGSFVDSGDDEIATALKLYNEAGTQIGTVASGSSTVNDGTVTVGLAPPPAPDNNECGAAPSGGGTITCNQNTYIYQTADPVAPADAGIEYNALSGANDYTINISGTIDVDATAAADRGLHAEHSEGSSGTGDLTINLSGGSIDTDGENAGDRLHADGILARMRNAGNLAVTMSGGSIDTEGKYADGILAQVYTDYTDNTGTGSVTVNLTSAIDGGTCTAANRSGCDIHTEGEEDYGIYASAGASGASTTTGTVTIGMAGGNILTEGKWSDGLNGRNDGSNDVTIAMSGGSIETGAGTAANTGQAAEGIYGSSDAAKPGDLTITMSNGRIATGTGSGTNAGAGARGIHADHAGTGSATVTLSGGRILTQGGRYTTSLGTDYDADGILLTNEGQGGNTSTVTMSGGSIDTEGAYANGIRGRASTGGSIGIELTSAIAAGTCDGTTNTGCDIRTKGNYAHGIYGYAGPGRLGLPCTHK